MSRLETLLGNSGIGVLGVVTAVAFIKAGIDGNKAQSEYDQAKSAYSVGDNRSADIYMAQAGKDSNQSNQDGLGFIGAGAATVVYLAERKLSKISKG